MANLALDALVVFVGISWGLAVGSGLVAFMVVLDIIPRLAQLTRSYRRIHWYEGAVVSGAVFGTMADFFDWTGSASPVAVGAVGLLSGVFVGMLAAALTEVVNVLPILAKRLQMASHIVWLLMAMVFGKICGSLFEFLLYR